MDIQVYLTHSDPAGAKTYIALDRYKPISIFYFPNSLLNCRPHVMWSWDSDHSDVRLELEGNCCSLTVWSHESKAAVVLPHGNFEVPVSSFARWKSIVVMEDHQFSIAGGRWQVEWDRSRNISNSMNPPPLPVVEEAPSDEEYYEDDDLALELVPTGYGEGLVDRQEMMEVEELDEHTGTSVVDIHLSPPPLEESTSVAVVNTDTFEEQLGSTLQLHKSIEKSDQADATQASKETTGSSSGSSDIMQVTISGNVDECPISTNPAELVPEEDRGLTKNGNRADQAPVESNPVAASEKIDDDERGQIVQEHSPKAEKETQVRACIDQTTIPSRDDSPVTQQTASLESTSSSNVGSDEETVSEDESQQQKDTRVPKRRMQEIENEYKVRSDKRQKTIAENRPETKLAATDRKGGSLPATPQPLITGGDEDIEMATPLSRKQPVTMPRLSKQSVKPTSTRKSKPISKSKAKEVLITPVRRSSRNGSEIPGPSVPLRSSASDFGSPRVIFGSGSAISKEKKTISMIERLGGTVVSDINKADVLCIGNGGLKKTSKLIIAIAKGIDVVTDDWLKQTRIDGKFPDRRPFLPNDQTREMEWGFTLSEALNRGRQGLNLLLGVHVYLTKQLRQDLGELSKELKNVALSLGATSVHFGLPKKNMDGQVLVIGSTKNTDPEGCKVDSLGYKLFGQDILTMSIFRGYLDLQSATEFVISVPVKNEPSSSQ